MKVQARRERRWIEVFLCALQQIFRGPCLGHGGRILAEQ